MSFPRILLITSYPANAVSGSIHHILALLERYTSHIVWYSIRPPRTDFDPPALDIPYQHGTLINRPSRPIFDPIKPIKHYLNLGPWAYKLGRDAAQFGRTHKVDLVWAELDLETIVAGRVAAKALGVPLAVSILDDPPTRLKVFQYPRWIQSVFKADFEKTMRFASSHGVISQSMGEAYKEQFDIEPIILFLGVDESRCFAPAVLDRAKSPIIIGSVGSVGSVDNWRVLIEAVRLVNRRYGDDKIRILQIGRFNSELLSPEVEVTGWVTGAVFDAHLARLDLGFTQLWFDPTYDTYVRTSFPTKISSYIRAQRPILAVGPAHSSNVRFVEEHRCGLTCPVPDPGVLAETIERLLFEPGVYESALAGTRDLIKVFSREEFYKSFEAFIHKATSAFQIKAVNRE